MRAADVVQLSIRPQYCSRSAAAGPSRALVDASRAAGWAISRSTVHRASNQRAEALDTEQMAPPANYKARTPLATSRNSATRSLRGRIQTPHVMVILRPQSTSIVRRKAALLLKELSGNFQYFSSVLHAASSRYGGYYFARSTELSDSVEASRVAPGRLARARRRGASRAGSNRR